MASLDTEIGGMPLAINAGLRYEDTDYTSSGASKTVISAKPRLDEHGDPTGQNDIVVSDIIPVSFHGKYRDWLPSLNGRIDVTDNMVLRFAGSKVMKDRKGVVWGKRVYVRVGLGGRGVNKKKKQNEE